jgi:hypothetical protein
MIWSSELGRYLWLISILISGFYPASVGAVFAVHSITIFASVVLFSYKGTLWTHGLLCGWPIKAVTQMRDVQPIEVKALFQYLPVLPT